MSGLAHLEQDCSEFVEVDPTGRYGRGTSKDCYRAFDEYEGIEVAWNQVKLYDFLQSPENLERLYCEIHLLKTLSHQNIMKFYTSWVDTANRNINFVTEMFTSGTLRQYRQKHKRVNIRAVKHWCRQILEGLLYLHSHDPPVIHRDLKCDNIFINGNQGEVKIGDLGLAAILRKSHAAHCVGTPEFMAPEVYEEEYNELVDIYSFGMCILEMVTFEYPYSECTHPAQIYKKVMSGKKPDALYKVEDPEVRQFVEKCLATVSLRLSARELLNDPFLRIDECEPHLRPIECRREQDYADHVLRQPFLELDTGGNSFCNSSLNGYSNGVASYADQNGWGYHPIDIEESRIRNIYFPFDIETDTALSVATEMVAELDITDQDVNKISDMIDGEIALLVPDWKPGPGIEETPRFANKSFCDNCASNHTSTGSFMNFLSNHPNAKTLQISHCAGNGCAAMHGRFEEVTYQLDSPRHVCLDGANNPVSSIQPYGFHSTNIWDRHESLECSSLGSDESYSIEEQEKLDQEIPGEDDKEIEMETKVSSTVRNFIKCLSAGSHSIAVPPTWSCDWSRDYDHEIQQELRWLKAKYLMELRDLRDQQLGLVPKSSVLHSSSGSGRQRTKNGLSTNLVMPNKSQGHKLGTPLKSSSVLHGHFQGSQRARKCEAIKECPSEEDMVTAMGFYTESFLPNTIHRTTSLPVDAVDI
ncbi:hypothetical protein RJ640_023589 [Escallonia rubra]|uniref:non-specific serine/threonine protein kinase n=1 Tax=Escallonia rubra TaxID=112253 RepID=A0AA88UKU4_9ASTE|nr:hypothetical protein RJ640_023589 [Escallonia rubra]